MRTLLLVTPVLALGLDLSTDYGQTRSLRTTVETQITVRTTAFEILIDGEPPPSDRGAGGERSAEMERTAEIVDHYLEGKAAAPQKMRRSFARLEEKSVATSGENVRENESSGQLSGVTLELHVGEDGEINCDVVDGDRPDDEALLENHRLTHAFDAWLPEGPAEQDSQWELDSDAVRAALAGSIDARLFAGPPTEEPAASGRGEGRRGGRSGRGNLGALFANLEWSAKASVGELETEHEGVPCTSIKLEIEAKGDLPEPAFRGGGRPRGLELSEPALGALDGTVTVKLEGVYYVSSKDHRPLALELEGTLASDSRMERAGENGEQISIHSAQEGTFAIRASVELEE